MSNRIKALRFDAMVQRFVPKFRRQIFNEKNRYIDNQLAYYRIHGRLSDGLETEHKNNMLEIFRRQYRAVMEKAYALSVQITGSKKSHEVLETKAEAFVIFLLEWVMEYGAEKAQQTANTTTDDMKRIIDKAFRDEDPAPVIIKKALKAKGLSAYRADTIARTETHQAAMYAHRRHIDAYASKAANLGITVKKQWIATNDERTRPWHSELSGTTIGLSEKFDADGELMDRPGDADASAHNTINCRCVLVTVDDF